MLLSISGKRGDVEFRNVDREMADKRGLTLAHIFNPSNEDEQKEIKGVEVAISDLTRERMSKAEVMENDDILEDLECSDETFILFLKNVTFDDDKDKIEECSGITFWDLDSKVVKFRDYRVSQNFIPILEKLFIKYGDISEKSPLNLGTKTRFLIKYILWSYIACTIQRLRISIGLYFSIVGRTLSLCKKPSSISSLPSIICIDLHNHLFVFCANIKLTTPLLIIK